MLIFINFFAIVFFFIIIKMNRLNKEISANHQVTALFCKAPWTLDYSAFEASVQVQAKIMMNSIWN